ncbi:hypothetical protein TSOC_007049 [Tetrabaena socialis]|uniref:TRAF-type domain-containing protein n=1 Tax=Tetrabaena socialis TaxID=47790 RepID=A0A2J8A261_9CHLO|nr:hypothetical protein TSOC_007049 [Tetrabaena socialis]|eukprot:PNH06600.1 hypothetical protein TSOC_007049 [Tetrabaena socialis]
MEDPHPAIARVSEELVCPICLETAQLPVNFACFRGCGGSWSHCECAQNTPFLQPHTSAHPCIFKPPISLLTYTFSPRTHTAASCLRSAVCMHCACTALQLGRQPPARFPDASPPGFAHCLVCRETRCDARMLTPENSFALNFNLMSVMDALRMGATCRSCDEELDSQSTLHQHYLRRCPAAVVRCRFRACAHWHVRSDAAAHEEACGVGRAVCGQCGEWADRSELLRHMVATCRFRVVNCMLCKHATRLPDMLEHLRLHQSQLQVSVSAAGAAAAAGTGAAGAGAAGAGAVGMAAGAGATGTGAASAGAAGAASLAALQQQVAQQRRETRDLRSGGGVHVASSGGLRLQDLEQEQQRQEQHRQQQQHFQPQPQPQLQHEQELALQRLHRLVQACVGQRLLPASLGGRVEQLVQVVGEQRLPPALAEGVRQLMQLVEQLQSAPAHQTAQTRIQELQQQHQVLREVVERTRAQRAQQPSEQVEAAAVHVLPTLQQRGQLPVTVPWVASSVPSQQLEAPQCAAPCDGIDAGT